MRILLISYYFPPCGGAAVQRWLRFLPLLIARGHQIEVITPLSGDFPRHDPSLLDRIPPEVTVHRVGGGGLSGIWKRLFGAKSALPYGSLDSSGEPSRLKRMLLFLRLHLVYPDIRRMWNGAAYRKAEDLLRRNAFDLVITTAPPHSTHLVGLKLKRIYPVRWITDFRDPWTQIYYLQINRPNPLTRWLNGRLERQVLASADLNIIVSEDIATHLPPGKKAVLYNGFDQDQFSTFEYTRGDKFRIRFIGQLTQGQDIASLLKAIGTALEHRKAICEFIGTAPSAIPPVNEPQVMVSDFVPQQEALRMMVDCELLLLVINDYAGNRGMLTTKLFEYIGSRTPILCFGPRDGEAAAILSRLQAGKVFEQTDDSAMTVWLNELYNAWEQGAPLRNQNAVDEVSTQRQITQLESFILPANKKN